VLSLRNNLPVQENVFGWNSDDARTYVLVRVQHDEQLPWKTRGHEKIQKKNKIKNSIFKFFFFLHFILTYFTNVFTHTALVSAATCFSIL